MPKTWTMVLDKIIIANFRSFTDEQEFVFPKAPGLYFMQGINEVEPRLGANGAGKSTIWDALTWCLFGKTSRGLKAGDVCHWGSKKGTKVVLSLYDTEQGIGYEVTRTWGPIRWTLRSYDMTGEHHDFDDTIDLAKDASNPILGLLRLEFLPFLNCILTAQGQPMFLDQKSEAQAGLFSDVLGLDRWLAYAGVASSKASAQDSISRVLERRLAGLKGQLGAIRQDDLTISIKDWEKDRARRLDEIEAQYKKMLAQVDALKVQQTDLDERVTNQRARVAGLREPWEAIKDDHDRVERELSDYRMLKGIDERELAGYEKELKHLEDHDQCPSCGQRLPKAEHQAQISKVRQSIRQVTRRLDTNGTEVKRLELRSKDLAKELRDGEDAFRDEQITLDNLIADLASTRREIASINKELDRLEDQSEELEAQVNPYQEMQDKAKRDHDRITDELADVQRQLDDSTYRYSILSYWVKGFKELRLQMISEALVELEIEVNSCVAALGLVDWELKFQVDRETKSGSIQRGFSVLVRSPHNDAMVPWESWSGGEAQRLRLAGTMGLANLIRSRSATELDLEVWDEPTRDLSPSGVHDLLSALATRAQQEQRMIWLVDHRTYDFGGFAGGVTVVKTKRGSRLVPTIKESGE